MPGPLFVLFKAYGRNSVYMNKKTRYCCFLRVILFTYQNNSGKCLFSGYLFSILLGLLLSGQPLVAQSEIKIPFLKGIINLDGIPDEDIWKNAESFPLVMHSPETGKTPSQRTDVRLFFDETCLYLAYTACYSDSSMISRIGKTRDFSTSDSDWCGIAIDSYNDKQNCFLFLVNPNGIRTDGLSKNDLLNGSYDINFDYNTFWDAEVKIKGNIWYSEIRIPLSSLRFQEKDGRVTMGITILRSVANANEPDYGQATWPLIPQAKGTLLFWKASMSREVVFTGLKSKKPVYLTPYLLGGVNRFYDPEALAARSNYKFNAGGDFKYGLTNNLTLDVTVNTDFAQVEADQEQFNLTRFNIYLPEKRLFFQEKADVFDFLFYPDDNLFYSRNIGLHNGKPVGIYGGVRLTGRTNGWELGFLDMQTAKLGELPSENFGVLRTKKQILNQNSYVGEMITTRFGADGSYNAAYGVDTRLNLFGDDYLSFKWAQTFYNNAPNKIFSSDPTQAYMAWRRKRIEGFAYLFIINWSGENYNPGIGLKMRNSFFMKTANLQYGWLPGKGSPLNSHSIMAKTSVYNSTTDGSLESVITTAGWNFMTRKTTEGYIYLNWELEDLKENFMIVSPDLFILSGRYNFFYLSGNLYTSTRNRVFSLTFNPEAGTYYDGYKLSCALQPGFSIGSGVIISGSYRLDRVVIASRSQKYTNNIFGLKSSFLFTTKLSFSTYIQFNKYSDRIITNARLRYNPKEGNDFYIVYDEGISSMNRPDFIVGAEKESRTLLIKYTYTFPF